VAVSADGVAAGAVDCPDSAQRPGSATQEIYDLAPEDFSATIGPVAAQAGGPTNLANCSTVPSAGYVTQSPQVMFYLPPFPGGLSSRESLLIEVSAPCETFLLVENGLVEGQQQWLFARSMPSAAGPSLSIANPPSTTWPIGVGAADPAGCPVSITFSLLFSPD
jgi:hypothetical protein